MSNEPNTDLNLVGDPENLLKFLYTNHAGETRIRTVVPYSIWFGTSHYHTGDQWFLKALDTENDQFRDFALSDANFTVTEIDEVVQEVVDAPKKK